VNVEQRAEQQAEAERVRIAELLAAAPPLSQRQRDELSRLLTVGVDR
jgi:hypothetical protein